MAEGQLRDYEGRIGSEFAHSRYMGQLADLRDRLKLGLSEKPPEGGESVPELAERIKALREENAVEAAPERTGARKKVAGETPVTVRIRARRGEVVISEVPSPESSQSNGLIAEIAVEVPYPPPETVIALPETVKPAGGYRKQVAARRQGGEAQMRLF